MTSDGESRGSWAGGGPEISLGPVVRERRSCSWAYSESDPPPPPPITDIRIPYMLRFTNRFVFIQTRVAVLNVLKYSNEGLKNWVSAGLEVCINMRAKQFIGQMKEIIAICMTKVHRYGTANRKSLPSPLSYNGSCFSF